MSIVTSKLLGRLSTLYGLSSHTIREHGENVYVYPASYGTSVHWTKMDQYAGLIVVSGEVVKDNLGLFGIGYKF